MPPKKISLFVKRKPSRAPKKALPSLIGKSVLAPAPEEATKTSLSTAMSTAMSTAKPQRLIPVQCERTSVPETPAPTAIVQKSGLTIIRKRTEPETSNPKPKPVRERRRRQPKQRPKPGLRTKPKHDDTKAVVHDAPLNQHDQELLNDSDSDSEELEVDLLLMSERDFKKLIKGIKQDVKVSSEARVRIIDDLTVNRDRTLKTIKQLRRNQQDTHEADRQLNVLTKMLAQVKELHTNLGVALSKKEKRRFEKEFKLRFKRLDDEVFQKTIDLTAPKHKRKPEIGMTIWNEGKEQFKTGQGLGAGYSKATAKKEAKTKALITHKRHMDDDMINKLNQNFDSNLTKVNVVQNQPQLLQYQRYNPFTHQRVNYY